MLSINDLLDYSELDQTEIEAIAEHEHIPLPVAIELGDHLLHTVEGVRKLHTMVIDNMQHAVEHGNYEHANGLAATYLHLQRTHPFPIIGAAPC